MTQQEESTVFVPNGDSRRETAILLLGTAEEHDIDPTTVKAVNRGFMIPESLADALDSEAVENGADIDDEDSEDIYTPADHSVEQVKGFVTDNPETAQDVLLSEQAGKNRSTLVEWLTEFINSNNDSEE